MNHESAPPDLRRQLSCYLNQVVEPVRNRAEINTIIAQLLAATCDDLDRQIAEAFLARRAVKQRTAAYAWMAVLIANKHLDRMGDITWNRADRKLACVLLDVASILQAAAPEPAPGEPEQISLRWQQTFSGVSPTMFDRLAHQLVDMMGNIEELIVATQEQITRVKQNKAGRKIVAAGRVLVQ